MSGIQGGLEGHQDSRSREIGCALKINVRGRMYGPSKFVIHVQGRPGESSRFMFKGK